MLINNTLLPTNLTDTLPFSVSRPKANNPSIHPPVSPSPFSNCLCFKQPSNRPLPLPP
ncbi:hypothetical protein BDP81DRAFT_422347 [Colletotrichum phormii]|uniref:Uncharacterized protein n=1 Tax=Colletotrichum phormii TaxID=359342 RepID=A0AAI9ZUY8_9PEZI|nr:uncharacterized protein BDP81DRAFT_422347 [Colletotrichum phormii]KAK1638623.1 hypothetical protein BDP81DRAFT_422347 [Colletotrichum phormii]